MTNLLRRKRDKERDDALRSKKSRQKKIRALKVLLLTVTVLVGVAFVVNSLNSGSSRHRLLLPTPSQYQQGIIVNNESKTFAFEWEWNFNFTSGSNVTLRLLLKGGAGVQVTFGTTAAVNSYSGPFLYTAVLKPSDPAKAWTGIVPSGGGYRLELGNLGSESDLATVQLYAEAKV